MTNFSNNAHEEYDPKEDNWTKLEPMPTLGSGIASAITDESIYIFEGEDRN